MMLLRDTGDLPRQHPAKAALAGLQESRVCHFPSRTACTRFAITRCVCSCGCRSGRRRRTSPCVTAPRCTDASHRDIVLDDLQHVLHRAW